MPFDGSGNFDRVHNFSADASAGIQAQATRFDAELDGMATGLENCQTLTGETTPTADSPMGGFKHTGVAAATSAGNYLRSDQSSNQVGIYVRDTNTSETGIMSASAAVFPLSFTDGQRVTVKVSASGSATAPRVIIINGLSANVIDNEGSAMPATRMLKDETFDLIYDSSAVAFRAITDVKKIATSAEVSTGTDVLKIVTPATLKSFLDIETGSFTANWVGFTTSPTTTVDYTKLGNIVIMVFGTATELATSDSTDLRWTTNDIPASIAPSKIQRFYQVVQDNGSNVLGSALIDGGTRRIDFGADAISSGLFTATGTKGIPFTSVSYVYMLD